MSKVDFEVIADSCIDAINFGYVKKKDASEYVRTVAKHIAHRGNLNYDRFVQYIQDGLLTRGVKL